MVMIPLGNVRNKYENYFLRLHVMVIFPSITSLSAFTEISEEISKPKFCHWRLCVACSSRPTEILPRDLLQSSMNRTVLSIFAL